MQGDSSISLWFGFWNLPHGCVVEGVISMCGGYGYYDDVREKEKERAARSQRRDEQSAQGAPAKDTENQSEVQVEVGSGKTVSANG